VWASFGGSCRVFVVVVVVVFVALQLGSVLCCCCCLFGKKAPRGQGWQQGGQYWPQASSKRICTTMHWSSSQAWLTASTTTHPGVNKRTIHTFTFLFPHHLALYMLCHSWSYFTLILKLDNGLVCLALWLITRGT
jgi:hypothetical protein